MGSFQLGQISRPSQIRTVLHGTIVSFVSVVLCFLILEAGYRVYRMQKYGIVEMADLKGHQAFVADPLYGSRPIKILTPPLSIRRSGDRLNLSRFGSIKMCTLIRSAIVERNLRSQRITECTGS